MIKVLFGGGFDIFHVMHLRSIEAAKNEGDYLIVMVNGDELMKGYKKKVPTFNEDERAEIIRSLRPVDEVVIKDTFDDMKYLKEHDVDVFVTGEEWRDTKTEEMAYMKAKGGRVVFLPYFNAEFMQKFKDSAREMVANKKRTLCENCHRLI